MAITYHLLGKSHGEGKGVSQYFWEVIRPLIIRDPRDVSNFLLPIIKHPTTGEEALVVETEAEHYTLTIHTSSTDELVDERTQTLENTGIITAQEKASLRSVLKEGRGQQVTVHDLIPVRYKTPPMTKTQEEMEADGWFMEV